METRDPSGTVHVAPAEGRTVRLAGLQLLTRKVSSEQTGGAYSLFEVEVGPGGGEPPHIQHREDECLCVLEGRFRVLIEDERFEAVPGSVVYVLKGTLHDFENVGDGMGRLLAVHTPGGPYERFVDAAGETVIGPEAPLTPGRRSSSQGFALLAAEHGIEICGPTGQTERSF